MTLVFPRALAFSVHISDRAPWLPASLCLGRPPRFRLPLHFNVVLGHSTVLWQKMATKPGMYEPNGSWF